MRLYDLDGLVNGLEKGDSGALWAQGFSQVKENTPISLPAFDYNFRSTCHIANRAGLRLDSDCDPRPEGAGECPRLHWVGPDGGQFFYLEQCLYPFLAGFALEFDTQDGKGPRALIGIDFDGLNGPKEPEKPYYGYGSQGKLRRINLRAYNGHPDRVMIRTSHTADQGQEYYSFEELNLNGGGAGCGYENGPSANAKSQCIDESSFSHFDVAIRLLGGSAHLGAGRRVSYSWNKIDILRLNASEPLISRANSEGARQHLVDYSGTGCTLLAGNRIDCQYTEPKPENACIVASELLHFEPWTIFDGRPKPGGQILNLQRCRCVTGAIKFTPGTTIEESGLLSMPDTGDHAMDLWIDNVEGMPIHYQRGGSTHWDYTNGGGADRPLTIRSKTISGIPDYTPILADTEQLEGVAAGGKYAALAHNFRVVAGGRPADVRDIRSNV